MALNNVSLTSGAPYDIQTEQTRLARLRKIADALQQDSMSATNPLVDAGKFKVPNWGDAIGKVAEAYAAKQQGNALDKRSAEVAQDYNSRLSSGITDFAKNLRGSVDEGVGPPGPENSEAPGAPPPIVTQGDPIKAIAGAMGSGIGPLQQLGMSTMAAMNKGMITPKDLMEHVKDLSPEAAAMWAKNNGYNLGPEFFAGRPKVNFEGGVATPYADGKIIGPSTPTQTYTQGTTNVGGVSVPIQTNNMTGKQEGSTGVSAPPALKGEDSFETGLAGDQIKTLSDNKAALTKQMQNLPSVFQVGALADKAMIGAPWSDLQLMAAKVGAASGFKPDTNSRIPATEQLNSFLGQRLLANAKPLGSGNGFSDRDLKFLSGIEGVGSIRDPRTVKALAALNLVGTMNAVENQDKTIEQAAATRGPGTAEKLSFYKVPLTMTQTPGSTLEQFKIYRDPTTGKWTSGLVDDAINGGALNQDAAGGSPATGGQVDPLGIR